MGQSFKPDALNQECRRASVLKGLPQQPARVLSQLLAKFLWKGLEARCLGPGLQKRFEHRPRNASYKGGTSKHRPLPLWEGLQARCSGPGVQESIGPEWPPTTADAGIATVPRKGSSQSSCGRAFRPDALGQKCRRASAVKCLPQLAAPAQSLQVFAKFLWEGLQARCSGPEMQESIGREVPPTTGGAGTIATGLRKVPVGGPSAPMLWPWRAGEHRPGRGPSTASCDYFNLASARSASALSVFSHENAVNVSPPASLTSYGVRPKWP